MSHSPVLAASVGRLGTSSVATHFSKRKQSKKWPLAGKTRPFHFICPNQTIIYGSAEVEAHLPIALVQGGLWSLLWFLVRSSLRLSRDQPTFPLFHNRGECLISHHGSWTALDQDFNRCVIRLNVAGVIGQLFSTQDASSLLKQSDFAFRHQLVASFYTKCPGK